MFVESSTVIHTIRPSNRFIVIMPQTNTGERMPCRSSFTSMGLSRSLKSSNCRNGSGGFFTVETRVGEALISILFRAWLLQRCEGFILQSHRPAEGPHGH